MFHFPKLNTNARRMKIFIRNKFQVMIIIIITLNSLHVTKVTDHSCL